MKLDSLQVGMIGTNCYLLTDETAGNATAVIDPGGSADQILAHIRKNDLDVKLILLTHGHFDHIGGVAAVKAATGAKVVISAEDAPMLTSSRKSLAAFSFLSQAPAQADILVQDGDTVTLGGTVFTVLATPGHTPGGVCYIAEDCIFSGDTLFFCSCGRTDFPGGNSREIMDSLQKLAALPGDYTVYPGHDSATDMDYERKYNPYMKQGMNV